VVRIYEPIVSAVAFLHGQQPPVIHRDLKVENILVSTRAEAKLCDFGSATRRVMAPTTQAEIAQAEDEIQLNTTPQYRAPEMWDLYSRVPVGPASDVWALGCVLYKLCYYRTPYDDGSKMAICNADLKLPAGRSPNVVFHDLLRATLHKDPAQRPTATQLLAQVQALKASLGASARSNNGQDPLHVSIDSLVPATAPAQALGSGSAGGGGGGMQRKLMGALKNVKSLVEEQLAAGGAQPAYAAHGGPGAGAGGEAARGQAGAGAGARDPAHDMDWSYITPRVIVMKVPSMHAVDQMRGFVETSHKGRYFVWNLSDTAYSPAAFGNRVRQVAYPKKGVLGLAELYDTCMAIHAWLLADRDHVAVVHCAVCAALRPSPRRRPVPS
jgi:hypothetical protein